MGYLIAAAIFLLILAIGVMLLRASSRRAGRERSRAAADERYGEGVPGSDMAILAEEPGSPLGDTSEHAGSHERGETVSDPEDDGSGRRRRAADDADIARPVVGGEGEGLRRTGAHDD